MRKLITFFILCIILFVQLKAQSPHVIKYQTVIRNNSGEVVVNKLVAIKVSIIANNSNGNIVYQEIQNTNTNQFGIANLNIGDGTVQIGNFNNIYWGNNIHFLKIEIDLDNSTNFVFISSTKLLSVPYALYAAKTASADDNSDKDSVNELQIIQKTASTVSLNKNGGSFTDSDNQQLSINGYNVSITNANTITLPSDYDTDSLNEIQNITKNGNIILLSKNGGNVIDNDNQTLSISGNQLQISNGNSITLAGFVDMDGDSLNEIQTLSKHGDTLVLSVNGGSIRISNLHNLSSTNNGTNRTLNISEGNGTSFNIADYDNDSINELQTLSYANDTLNLSKGNYVKLPTGFNGQYSSLTGKPNLATVATTGSYKDLSDTIIGNNIGDIKYWNGNAWVMLPIGQPNQFLQLNSSNLPEWKGSLPILTTNSVSILTNTIATLGGNILNDGGITILQKGICWDTLTNPVISKNKTFDGIGIDNFTTTLSGLIPSKTYFARAYTINMMGTTYGNQISFTTLAKPVADIDGNVYDTVHIGSQIWLKQNLKTTHYRTGDSIPNVTDSAAWTVQTSGAYCNYNNNISNANIYGRLYNWFAVNDSRNLCPTSFHVPSDVEWTILTTYLGGENIAGQKLKETGISHWNSPNTSTNISGFTALPSGYRHINGNFANLTNNAYWWCSTQESINGLFKYVGSYNEVNSGAINKSFGYSVRCLMNNTSQSSLPMIITTPLTNITPYSVSSGGNISSDGGAAVIGRGVCWDTIPNPTFFKNKTTDSLGSGSFTSLISGLISGKNYYLRAYAINSEGIAYGNELNFKLSPVYDIDGNAYDTVKIGNQIWLKSSLKTTKYRNGDSIPNLSDHNIWRNLTTGAYQSCLNFNEIVYLYNGFVVTDNRNICPTGWHVPTDNEWTSLTNLLGGESTAAIKLKDTLPPWTQGNSLYPISNSSGFSAHPSGYIVDDGNGGCSYTNAHWWSSSLYSNGDLWYRWMIDDGNFVSRNKLNKKSGLSIRCLKGDKPILTTLNPSVITNISAICGGNISSDEGLQITARGVCWSTSPYPTLANSFTSDSLGIGSFTNNITGLSANTFYYVRAYATNSAGTTYGNMIGFLTTGGTLAVNQSYQGGIIFYLLQPGDLGYNPSIQHGLIAPSNSPYNNLIVPWGCQDTLINGADSSSIGYGMQNTIDIMAGCSASGIAARICGDLVFNGYSDWYLPSKDELNKLMFSTVNITMVYGANYWSSTQNGYNSAFIQQNGYPNSSGGLFKNSMQRFIAIRSF